MLSSASRRFRHKRTLPITGRPLTHVISSPDPRLPEQQRHSLLGQRKLKTWDREELPLVRDDQVIAQERASLHSLDLFDLSWCEACSTYVERILIDWGPGTRSWSQWADRGHKSILELRLDARERPFPGFGGFRERISSLSGLPQSWRTALESVRGVYLLVTEQGQQYVGSAYGADGFIGRWRHFGPVALSCRPKCSFRPPSVRMRQGFSSPVLSGGGVDCRSH